MPSSETQEFTPQELLDEATRRDDELQRDAGIALDETAFWKGVRSRRPAWK